MKLISRDAIRGLDAHAIETCGMPGVALMETAGGQAARHVESALRRVGGGRVAIACGGGNNGGDGYVIARHLAARGVDVIVLVMADPERVDGDARRNFDLLEHVGVEREVVHPSALGDAYADRLDALATSDVAVWVDGLLGTGLSSKVRAPYNLAIEMLRTARGHGALIVALDTPSGLDVDTGQTLGTCVHADETVTFGFAKPGLCLGAGREHVGRLHVVDLGFPTATLEQADIEGERLGTAATARLLGPRPRASHKGSCGRVLLLAGSPGMAGAALLSGSAALRAGAGLVTLGTHEAIADAVNAHSWELMVRPLLPSATFDDHSRASLEEAMASMDVVAIGPGMGVGQVSRRALECVLGHADGVVVIDADGLNVAAHDTSCISAAPGTPVLTPHPGEMARLLETSTSEVMSDPLRHARSLARELQALVVLKFADTVVAHWDGRYAINSSGTPGLATAGTGDVLTGLIAGLAAQGLDAWDAARVGVFVHGKAGERGVAQFGERALTARDVLDALGAVLRSLELRL